MCLLIGCRPAGDFRLHDITGHMPALQFSLTDDSGRTVSAETYKDRVVLLYFGFTGCSSQCPVVLSRLASGMQRAGVSSAILFVTLDPAHDTPDQLHRYVSAFHGAPITGLTGDRTAIDALARRYRIAVDGVREDMTHSNAVFIFDAHGRARLLLTPGDTDDALVHDLRLLSP